MANRLTQEAVEVLQVGGNPNARLTQAAVEVLQVGGNPNARLTQVSVEVLVRLSLPPVTGGARPIMFVVT